MKKALYSLCVILGISFLFTLLMSCHISSTKAMTIIFDNIEGLIKGAPVICENKTIGRVTHIEYTDNGQYKVDIKLHIDDAPLTTKSIFYIDNNKDTKALYIFTPEDRGEPLPKNAEIKGVTRVEAFIKMGHSEVRSIINQLQQNTEKLLRSLEAFPDSKQVKELEKLVDETIEHFARETREGKEFLKNQIIPTLKKELKRLREALKEDVNQQKKLDNIEKKLRQVSNAQSGFYI